MIKKFGDFGCEVKNEGSVKPMPAKSLKLPDGKESVEETTKNNYPKSPEDFVSRQEFESFCQQTTEFMSECRAAMPSKKIGKVQGKEIKRVRDKWMSSLGSEKPVLYNLFGTGYFRIWDMVRSLSIAVPAKGNAINLSPEEDAFVARLADELCDVLEKYRKEYIESGKAKNVGRKYADKITAQPKNQSPASRNTTAFDETTYAAIEALSDSEFDVFFMKWAIQHHIMVYPDQKRSFKTDIFKDYYRINSGDIKRVLATLEVKQDV